MRKIYSIVLMATALLIGTNVWADDISVINHSQETTLETASLQDAVNFAGPGDSITITLNADITLDSAVVMPIVSGTLSSTNKSVLERDGQKICLNLNGHKIQGANNLGCIQILKGSLNITGAGEILRGAGAGTGNRDKSVITIFGAPWSNKTGVWSELTIGENVTVKTAEAEKVYGLCIQNFNGASQGPNTKAYTANDYKAGGKIGYVTYLSGKKANAPTDKCWAPATWNATKTDYSDYSAGCGYGIKVTVKGKIFGNYRGINVVGNLNAAPQCDINETIKERTSSSYPYFAYNYPYVKVESTATIWCINDGVVGDNNGGIYAGGYAVWDISGYVHGQTGIYAKAGDFKLLDATVASDSKTVGTDPNYHQGSVAGSGIFLGTDAGYAGGTALTLEGDTKVSGGSDPQAKGIVDEVATNAVTEGADISHVTVNGGTIEGGISLTQGASEVTTVYGSTITGTIVVDGTTTTVATLTPTDGSVHVTEVTINGKPTVVVSQGEGPADDAKKTTWNEIAALSDEDAPVDVAWTAVGEGTISSDLYFGELQMISGTDASNIQKLTINNGATLNVKHLMMNNFAQIIVEPGAKLIVNGKQGIVAPVASNILLKASESAQATFLFNPAVTSNRHPNATVQLISKSFYEGGKEVHQRFGMPTYDGNVTLSPVNPGSVITMIKTWDYAADDWSAWQNIASGVTYTDAEPFRGYMLASNNVKASPMTYELKGELVGNDDAEITYRYGWNNLANSYAAPINIKEFIGTVLKSTGTDILATIYLYKDLGNDTYTWQAVNNATAGKQEYVIEGGVPVLKTTPSEITPMQAFLMQLRAAGTAKQSVDYEHNVYNPALGIPNSNNAPARDRDAVSKMQLAIFNTEVADNLTLIEDDQFSSELDNGYDAVKYGFNNGLKLYAMNNEERMEVVATDNVEGTFLGVNAAKAGTYTMTLYALNGMEYAIVDMETGKVVLAEEGSTYNFFAEAGHNDYRFQIVESAKLPTAIENTEVVSNVKGIYTITGQYVGENFNVLPKGAYIVNGVKVIK